PNAGAPGTLVFMIDEFGWQVAIDGSLVGRYTGSENVPTVTEDQQAQFYNDLVRTLSCDPTVADLMVFHMIDEVDLGRFQSGVLRVDGSARSSFASVAGAIAAAGQCATLHQWTHTNGVVGAAATFDVHDVPAQQGVFGFSATAAEPADGKAGIFRV